LGYNIKTVRRKMSENSNCPHLSHESFQVYYRGGEVFVHIVVFWVVTSCSLVGEYQRFAIKCCFSLQGLLWDANFTGCYQRTDLKLHDESFVANRVNHYTFSLNMNVIARQRLVLTILQFGPCILI
jgi:hypothetical protein